MNPPTQLPSSLIDHFLANDPSLGRLYGVEPETVRAVKPNGRRMILWLIVGCVVLLLSGGGVFASFGWSSRLPAESPIPGPLPIPMVAVQPKPIESVLFSPGEQELTSNERETYERLFQDTRTMASTRLRQGSGPLSFWTEDNAVGANTIRDGRFREFYVDETERSLTLWFRNTDGPEGEFPRDRVSLHLDKVSGQSVVVAAVYPEPGAPIWLPKDVALNHLHQVASQWIEQDLKTSH